LLIVSAAVLLAISGSAQTAFNTIYSFQGGADGQAPNGVIVGKDGGLYGTTYRGGSPDCTNDDTWTQPCGTIFELTSAGTAWKNNVLYAFEGADGGAFPDGLLVFDGSGTLYGTTYIEGRVEYGNGAVFTLAPPLTAGGTWTETVIYVFGKHPRPQYGYDPFIPISGVLLGPNGRLFGVTHYDYWTEFETKGGAIYQLEPPTAPGGAWTEYTLYSFSHSPTSPGDEPVGGLIYDGSTFYGTVWQGGTVGCGAAFQATPTPGDPYTVEALHEFTGAPDGCGPMATLTLGPGGIIYGATANGGISTAPCPSNGCGVVFQLTPPASVGAPWTEDVIYSFTGANGDGAIPSAVVVLSPDGALYGTTEGGGAIAASNPDCSVSGVPGCGTVFKLTPSAQGGAWTETVLHDFTGENGEGFYPGPYLTPAPNGKFYGTTLQGGTAGYGTVFDTPQD
jgi:hypothetical protein